MASWNFFSRWHRDSWLLECLVKCHNQLIFSISGNNCNRFMVQEKAEVVCDVCFSGIGDENIEALIMIWSMHQTPAIFSTWISGRTLLWVGSWVHYILLYDQTAAWVLWIAADVGHPVPMSIAWFLAWDWYLNYYFFHPHAHHDCNNDGGHIQPVAVLSLHGNWVVVALWVSLGNFVGVGMDTMEGM